MESHKDIVSEFDLFDKKTDALQDIRENALKSFDKLGFPTIKNEEWKYTSVKSLIAKPLDFVSNLSPTKITKEQISNFNIGGQDCIVVVFENGKLNKSLSVNFEKLNNITVQSIAESISDNNFQKYFGKIANFENEAFVALNTAFVNDGIFIHVPEKIHFETPIHVLHINTSENNNTVATIRNLIIAETGSSASIIESYHSLNENIKGLTNSVSEILVKKNAVLEITKAQLESKGSSQINYTQVHQERDSTFNTATVTLGGALVRNNLHIKLNDENCTSHLYGLYILNNEQLVDNHTLVDHAMPNCYSNELYKGIMDDKATGVFNGKIFVRKDAQKTNAYQSNKNILLSDDAQMNTKPQLEIFADDVKCTHGATTGQLDEEALFYLRARGIGEKNARTLLNIAFAADVLSNIKSEELRNNLQNLAETKLMN